MALAAARAGRAVWPDFPGFSADLTLRGDGATLDAQASPESGNSRWLDTYREPAARLIGEAVSSTFAWDRLSVLTDTIGNRLSGTPALERAIQWAVAEMTKDGLENVHTERVMVPKWVRGNESAEISWILSDRRPGPPPHAR